MLEGAGQQPKAQGAGPNVVALWQDDRGSSFDLMLKSRKESGKGLHLKQPSVRPPIAICDCAV